MRRGRPSASPVAGFTLLEAIIAIGLFTIVSSAVFIFARTQIRARKQTQHLLDTEQNARVALDAIRADVQSSGLGVGYAAGGAFLGVTMGPFGPPAAPLGTFESNNFVHAGGQVSDDLRVRGALGPARTIAAYDAPLPSGSMEVCAGGGFQPGDEVLLVSESYQDARVVTLSAVSGTACSDGQCVGPGGCELLSFSDASGVFETDPNARFASYLGGTALRGFIDVTYFVEWNGAVPGLYRAEGACASRAACAIPDNLLGEGVESLQVRVLEHDPASAIALDQTSNATYRDPIAGGVTSTNRVRLEVEVVARSRSEESETPEGASCSTIDPTVCFPLGGGKDRHRRRKLMTSIELKNSGHMRFSALR